MFKLILIMQIKKLKDVKKMTGFPTTYTGWFLLKNSVELQDWIRKAKNEIGVNGNLIKSDALTGFPCLVRIVPDIPPNYSFRTVKHEEMQRKSVKKPPVNSEESVEKVREQNIISYYLIVLSDLKIVTDFLKESKKRKR